MSKLGSFFVNIGIATAVTVCLVPLAAAQATRTWVSGVGDDANPCSRTAPCKTFAGAISKTARDGEISVLDPGGFGTVTITKSITINGTPGAGYGSILSSGGLNGVIINITDPADTRKTVRLNWLDINGAGTGLNGIRILAGNIADTSVFVENSVIDGFTARAISDERANAGKLFVSNTAMRNLGQTAVFITAGAKQVLLDNVRVENASFGTAFVGGNKAMISRSVFSGHSQAGIEAESTADVSVTGSVIAHNGTGVLVGGGSPVIRLSNNDIAMNGTAITGTTVSFGNNRISGNTAAGTAPSAIGVDAHDKGQQ